MSGMAGRRIIVALDFAEGREALAFADRIKGTGCAVKVGKEVFTREGPAICRALQERGLPVFLDLKFHDIPTTVSAACRAAADLGVWMVNVHASGGRDMLVAAREALAAHANPPLLVAVTVLTSLDHARLVEVGINAEPAAQVERLARLAHDAGLDGVVCSPREIALVKAACGAAFLTVTPGVRPAGSAQDDQQRTASPAAACAAGGDYLVVGRPITRADDPVAAIAAIAAEIAQAG